MQENSNLMTWTGFWENSTSGGSKNSGEKQLADKWNRRSGTFGKTFDPEAREKRTAKILGFLKDCGFNAKGTKVLDIGCGTGALALPLARLGVEVTALDVSSGMLKRLDETSKEEGLSIRTVEGSWWSADIDALGLKKQYDLVMAARTPAIKNADCLKKMMDCSRDYCFYIGFISKNESSARRDISRFILKEEQTGNTTGMFFPFMYLYLAGYRPEIQVSFSGKKEELPWDEAAEKYLKFFSGERGLDDETREKIMSFFRESSVNGIYTSQSNMGEGMMLWEVGS